MSAPYFIVHKEIYDQVRFLDLNGNEVIRISSIDGQKVIVPDDKLQNKSDRYYFKEAVKLEKNQIFISPLDLNMEKGKIEEPINPTIRFGLPIFDYEEEMQGVLIINYSARQLLNYLKDTGEEASSDKLFLVNSDGYWLKGPSSEHDWGFMYDTRKEDIMAKDFPRAWAEISAQEQGQLINEKGLFTFNTLYPLLKQSSFSTVSSQYESSNEGYAWKIISFQPAASLYAHKQALQNKFIWVNAILILMIFIGIISYLKLQFKELDSLHDLEEKDAMVRNIVKTAFDGIITIDHHGLITSFNPAATAMYGYEESEVLGKNISIIVPEPHKSNHDDYLDRYIKTLEPHIIGMPRELDAVHKDGSTFPIELCVSGKKIDDHFMFIGITRDIRERLEMRKALELMATTDGLTQVYNRAFFTKQITYEYSRARRYNLNLSMILLDIDFFKTVNDEHGHPAGDAMLKCIAEVTKQVSRDIDFVTRYGGEEFAVILPETNEKQAVLYAERLRKAIEKSEITYEDKVIKRTASIGVACVSASHPDSSDHFIKMVDDALYKAKDSGRNQVVLWDESLNV